jgi:sterol 24-C-methyltransferase
MSNTPALLTSVPGVPQTQGNDDVVKRTAYYVNLHNENVTSEVRNEKYKEVVTNYYDLATDFYEKGWGESFHFCKQYKDETYREAIRRHEYYLASRLHLRDGMICLDVGCGIGGPLRNIAKFSGSFVHDGLFDSPLGICCCVAQMSFTILILLNNTTTTILSSFLIGGLCFELYRR